MIRVAEEIQDALAGGQPVVALESTVFSRLGLPAPDNASALRRCIDAVRGGGAVPAITAVLDGVARVGITEEEHERVLAGNRKVGVRDLAVAVAGGWPVGVTTVSASVTLAARAGIRVFATGGIGGVHRDADVTGDVSSDLPTIAREPVIVVTAGAKAFLDLRRTLEYLETLAVPVLGWHTDRFPAFYVADSGLEIPVRVDDAEQVAAIDRNARVLGYEGGIVLAVPIPAVNALEASTLLPVIEEARAAASRAGITGAAVTPFVLDHVADATRGRTVEANLALAEHNAVVAAQVAAALT